MESTIDPVWEEKYSQGHRQNYPWDCVVSFLYRNAPCHRTRDQTHVMEVGFGTGSNLWFAAREGFSVSGIEGSQSAVHSAIDRFEKEGLEGDLRLGHFPDLPFPSESIDLAIDRAATTCVGRETAARTIREVWRVLRPAGRFYLYTYSSQHTSASSGVLQPDGRRVGIDSGTLVGAGGICFYDEAQIQQAIGVGWRTLAMEHVVSDDRVSPGFVHAEWRVTLEKIGC